MGVTSFFERLAGRLAGLPWPVRVVLGVAAVVVGVFGIARPFDSLTVLFALIAVALVVDGVGRMVAASTASVPVLAIVGGLTEMTRRRARRHPALDCHPRPSARDRGRADRHRRRRHRRRVDSSRASRRERATRRRPRRARRARDPLARRVAHHHRRRLRGAGHRIRAHRRRASRTEPQPRARCDNRAASCGVDRHGRSSARARLRRGRARRQHPSAPRCRRARSVLRAAGRRPLRGGTAAAQRAVHPGGSRWSARLAHPLYDHRPQRPTRHGIGVRDGARRRGRRSARRRAVDSRHPGR